MMANFYKQITEELRELTPRIFSEHDIQQLLAFTRGQYSGLIEPAFIKDPQKCNEIVFSDQAFPMLSKYLLKYHPALQAIVAKPCESRALVYYLSEGIIERENIIVIGINGCQGIKGNTACEECDVRNPVISDYTVGQPLGEAEIEELTEGNSYLLADMDQEERKKHLSEEFDRCTQCYACRDACPVCYCDHCFVESNQPEWLEEGSDPENDLVFHLMRSMHMAGRCINCGACEMSCPEGIDLRAMTAHLYHRALDIYQFKPGMSAEQPSLFSDFDKDDDEPGFLEV